MTYRTEELRRAVEDLTTAIDYVAREAAAIAYVAALTRVTTPDGVRIVDCARYIESLRPYLARLPLTDDDATHPGVSPEVSARIRARGAITTLAHQTADTRADLISTVRSARLASDDVVLIAKLIDIAALRHSEMLAKAYDLVATQRIERIRKFVESSS